MTWLFSDDNHRKAVEEIEQTTSDRATAIVGAAFVERDLKNAIEARLRADKDIIAKLFKPNGPLGSFEAKAGLGYLLRIYDKNLRKDLETMATIRNRFAHRVEPLKFTSREIKSLCSDLKIVDAKEYPKVPGKGLPDEMRSPPRLPKSANARSRYIQAVKLASIAFWEVSHAYVIENPDSRKWALGSEVAS